MYLLDFAFKAALERWFAFGKIKLLRCIVLTGVLRWFSVFGVCAFVSVCLSSNWILIEKSKRVMHGGVLQTFFPVTYCVCVESKQKPVHSKKEQRKGKERQLHVSFISSLSVCQLCFLRAPYLTSICYSVSQSVSHPANSSENNSLTWPTFCVCGKGLCLVAKKYISTNSLSNIFSAS